MRLNLELVTEFQELHLKTFGKPIPPEAAEPELLNLTELVRITQSLETKENVNEE